MKTAMQAPASDWHEMGPYRASASVDASADDAAFHAEVHAGARHAALTRRRAYVRRLLGRGERPSLWVMPGAPGALTVVLLLGALVLLRTHWFAAFEALIMSIVIPHALRAALGFAARRLDRALARTRMQMDPDVLAWVDGKSAREGFSAPAANAPSVHPGPEVHANRFVDTVLDDVELRVDSEIIEHAMHDLDVLDADHDGDGGSDHDTDSVFDIFD